MSAEHLQVQTATDSQVEAEGLARGAVDERLAACVQVVGPVSSTFRWHGGIERATEWICLMKTTVERFDALVAWVQDEHSYDTPEIIATPIVRGGRDYLQWMTSETQPS